MLFKSRKNFKFIDLFAGIGGFRSALTKLGGKCLYTNEWDKYSRQTYSARYGEDEVSNEDIREVNHKKIPSRCFHFLQLVHTHEQFKYL